MLAGRAGFRFVTKTAGALSEYTWEIRSGANGLEPPRLRFVPVLVDSRLGDFHETQIRFRVCRGIGIVSTAAFAEEDAKPRQV